MGSKKLGFRTVGDMNPGTGFKIGITQPNAGKEQNCRGSALDSWKVRGRMHQGWTTDGQGI